MKKSERSILITGFMGTGKTTVAKKLASLMKRKYLDTDEFIEKSTGSSPAATIQNQGECYFRKVESEALLKIKRNRGAVISTGGGTLLSRDNLTVFQGTHVIFCLTAKADTIKKRLAGTKERPLFDRSGFEVLLFDRQPAYLRMFHQIQTDNKTPEQIALEIQTLFNSDESFRPSTLWVRIPNQRPYPVIIKKGGLKRAGEFISYCGVETTAKVALITNKKVKTLYAKNVTKALKKSGYKVCVFDINDGEQNKTLKTVKTLYKRMLKKSFDRNDCIFALGGGVTGDVAGFVAATFKRGIRFVQAPTSLLAMVDASVGGKTGVDLPEGKNLVGAFKQPLGVLIDTLAIKTLPTEEIHSGFGEIAKHCLISGQTPHVMNFQNLVRSSVQVKVNIVEKDPFEEHERAKLNLGHTFAHAFEKVSQYKMKHGEAVALGLVAAAHLSVLTGLAKKSLPERVLKLLEQFKLNLSLGKLSATKVLEAMEHDKKKQAGKLAFVLLKDFGQLEIVTVLDKALVKKAVLLLAKDVQ